MALNDPARPKTPTMLNTHHSLISQAMQTFVVLCVIAAVVFLSTEGDMDKATAGSLLGIVLGHTGAALSTNLRSRHTDVPSNISGD